MPKQKVHVSQKIWLEKYWVAIWKADEDLKVEQVGDQDDGVAEQESQAMVETVMIDKIKSRTWFVIGGCLFKTHLGQNSVWRRRGCNGGKATMAEANCDSQCEQIFEANCEQIFDGNCGENIWVQVGTNTWCQLEDDK